MQRETKKDSKTHQDSSKIIDEKPPNNSVNRRLILPAIPGLTRIIPKRKYPISPTASIEDKNVLTIALSSSTKTSKSSPIRAPSPKRQKKDTKPVKSLAGSSGITHDILPLSNKKRKTLKELKYEKLKRHVNLQKTLEHDQRVIVNKTENKKNEIELCKSKQIADTDYASCSNTRETNNKTLLNFTNDTNTTSIKQLYYTNEDWSSDSSD